MKKENRKIDSKLAAFIRSMVNRSSLTCEEWSEELGVSTRIIQMYCTGERRPEAKRLLSMLRISKTSTEGLSH